MRVFVDLDTQNIITGPGIPQAVRTLDFKRSPFASLEVQFCRTGQIVELPVDATGIFEVKPVGKYDSDPVTGATSWTKYGTGTDTFYAFVLTFITVPLDDLFNVDANVDNDVALLKLMGEIEWSTSGVRRKTQTVDVTLHNDVIREGDLLPAMPPVSYGVFIPGITDLVGGTPSDLDALPTVGILLGTIIEVLVEVSGELTWLTYRMDPGPATESPPAEVQPLDYNATTNDKHWRGAVGPSGPAGEDAGIPYLWNTATATADPGAGKVAINNAAVASATELYISELDNNAVNIAALLATWDDGTSPIHGRVMFQDPETPANFAVFDITGVMTDNGGWNTFLITPVAGGGTLTNNLPVQVFFYAKGDQGDPGSDGSDGQSGFKFLFNSGVSGDPGTGKFLFDNATFASATAFHISETDANANGLAAFLAQQDEGTSTNKTLVVAQKLGGTGFFSFYITGTLTDVGGYDTFPITPIASGGAAALNDVYFLSFIRLGDPGPAGAAGPGGLAGLRYQFYTGTAAANPGTGHLSVNNSSLASATTLYISEVDSNGNNLGSLLSTWDDTIGTIKGRLFIQSVINPGAMVIYSITGTRTDFGAYNGFTISYITHNGAFDDDMALVGIFLANGNDGGTSYDTPVAIGSGTSPVVDLSLVSMSTLRTLTGNTSVTLVNPVAGKVTILHFKQAAASSYTLVFPAVTYWQGTAGAPPVMTPGFNKVDVFTIWSDGTNLYGSWSPGA